LAEQVIALEALRMGKRYGRGRPALVDIDLSIPAGGLTGLVGPNGAGKSTLIKAWVGLERPTAGAVAVYGVDPWRERSRAIARVAYVPQAPAVYRGLTVDQHLAYAAALRPGFDRRLAERRLDDLGVPLRQRAGSLSGGQAAQLGLAIALGARARVLILDEPLASLDPLARREFLDVLTDAVAADGATGVLSSHVISDVEEACDRLLVLGSGRLVLETPIAEALRDHIVTVGDAPAPAPARRVATFVGARHVQLHLWRSLETTQVGLGARAASLEEVVIGYLAASRSGAEP
jgi:ABC-2 type transport system ATP-binding protein